MSGFPVQWVPGTPCAVRGCEKEGEWISQAGFAQYAKPGIFANGLAGRAEDLVREWIISHGVDPEKADIHSTPPRLTMGEPMLTSVGIARLYTCEAHAFPRATKRPGTAKDCDGWPRQSPNSPAIPCSEPATVEVVERFAGPPEVRRALSLCERHYVACLATSRAPEAA